MKLKKITFAAVIVSGSLGLAANSIAGPDHNYGRGEMPSNRYPTTSGDDQSMAPGVPGVTENNTSDMSAEQVRMVQQALAAEGYEPGRISGAMTNDTRAAIREFQKDNGIVVTGSLDSKTAQLLGIEVSQSSG